jgi:hypothetical protein
VQDPSLESPSLKLPSPEKQQCHIHGSPEHPERKSSSAYRETHIWSRLKTSADWPDSKRPWLLTPMPPSVMGCPTWRCRQTNFAWQKCARSAHSNTAEIVLSLTALAPVSTDLPQNVDPSILI